jgi:two-component system, chemotaxis family, chemotaxis protein CheY
MKTILTVDDSPSMRMLLRNTLTEQGHAVHEAEDGIAALEWLSSNSKPDLMITDINMPRMDGFGLVEATRAKDSYRDMPILVLTTESSDEKKARARAAGATGWIVKPFDPVKLASAIRRVTL